MVHADRGQVEIPNGSQWLDVGGLNLAQIHLAPCNTWHFFDVLEHGTADVSVDLSFRPEVVEHEGNDQVE